MDYIPLKDSDKILWNNNLNAKIEAQGALLGLDAEDIAELKRVTAENAAAIKTSNDAQVAAKTANAATGNLAATAKEIHGFKLVAARLADIDAKVDIAKLEETLMHEGLQKFADPQKALLALLAQKRASLVGSKK